MYIYIYIRENPEIIRFNGPGSFQVILKKGPISSHNQIHYPFFILVTVCVHKKSVNEAIRMSFSFLQGFFLLNLTNNLVCFGLRGFYGISTIVGYLIPKLIYSYKQFYLNQFSLIYVNSLKVKIVLFQTIHFSISTEFVV